ncbi:hypothetical protein FACS1894139_12100 [Planctomycetales bacterium]|nr:hypothetical protein FACS1894107_08840 [Planctomycetales bacterium]GHT06387.1 hypothetical protein FACS1894139_12100 [Planctomycetales bacterium]
MRILLLGLALFTGGFMANANDDFAVLVGKLKRDDAVRVQQFMPPAGDIPYRVFVHSAKMAPLLKNVYTADEVAALASATATARRIAVIKHPHGSFIQAASFESADKGEATHYDAVWVRDTLWGYLALRADDQPSARDVLLTMLDYLASPAQVKRMRAAVAAPQTVTAVADEMTAVHIRFDASSPTFDDVLEGGKPQLWHHKQNDALGLLLDRALTALADGTLTLDDFTPKRLRGLALLVAYFDATEFYTMEDAGAWEEKARRNTSSIALVTSALENLAGALRDEKSPLAAAWQTVAEREKLTPLFTPENLEKLIAGGYATIDRQLELGGESPDYPATDPRYRTADAALLNLIYPAKLSRLTLAQKQRVLQIVATLAGDYGIRRYVNDDYQSGNFWFQNIPTDTDARSYAERKRSFIPGTEAQWFFDSWFATAALIVYAETKEPADLATATRFANRAFGQLTGTVGDREVVAADGQKAPTFALPESYNHVVADGRVFVAPSPIIPLNWAKASLTLMLKELQKTIKN